MIIGKWINKAYFKMEDALKRCGISEKETESYVDKASESFESIKSLADGSYGAFETKCHTTDAIRHMYRIAKMEALRKDVRCVYAAFGPFCMFIAAGTAKETT